MRMRMKRLENWVKLLAVVKGIAAIAANGIDDLASGAAG